MPVSRAEQEGERGYALEGLQEGDKGGALVLAHLRVAVAGGLGFAAVPEDRFLERACAAVVQEEFVAGAGLGEPDTPERRRAPLGSAGVAFRAMIGEPFAHVVEQEVRVGPDQLESVLGNVGVAAGDELGGVAGNAAG